MTTTTPDASSTPTAPTDPITPAADAPPPMFHPAPAASAPAPAPGQATPAGAAPPVSTAPERMPWYRRVWVLAVGAVLLALLSFAGGFVAGNAAALFDGVFGVPTGVPSGPGWMDDGDGDGFGPGRPGFGDRGEMPGMDGTEDGTTSMN